MAEYRSRFPDVGFAGAKTREDLAEYFATSDAVVCPSGTDIFGLVTLEARASGLPIAAFPVPGPLDVIGGTHVGVLGEDLAGAAFAAQDIPAKKCRAYAKKFSWGSPAGQFLENLAPVDARRAFPMGP